MAAAASTYLCKHEHMPTALAASNANAANIFFYL
jgi:hypothetical protein